MDFDLAASRLAKDQQSALAHSRAQRAARTISAEALREGAAARAKAEKRLQEKSEASAQPSQNDNEEKKRRHRIAQAKYEKKNKCAINSRKKARRDADIEIHRKRTAERVRNHRRRSRERESDKEKTVTKTKSCDDNDGGAKDDVDLDYWLPRKPTPPPVLTADTPVTWLSDTVLQGDELELLMLRLHALDLKDMVEPTPLWIRMLDELNFFENEGKARPTSFWMKVIANFREHGWYR